MIATHKYSPPKTGGITLLYSPPSIRYIHKLSIYAIAFYARLNGLQVDQVNRENDKRTSTYTQLLANSSLPVTLPACNTRIQLSGCGLTIRAMPTHLLSEKLRSS